MRRPPSNPTLGTGLQIAAQHLPAIFIYALITATVGLVLRSVERRAGFVGQIVAGLFGAAWAVVTFLVVPVMVVEGQGPFAAIQRSAALLKQTSGEQLIPNPGWRSLTPSPSGRGLG
ncbi:MAG TPA: DUF6159 family protein [Chloroflexota bacterium]|nr:DUF6159 family protein [Chloroflexota bacterium]